jgi:Uma2 family endonuclease
VLPDAWEPRVQMAFTTADSEPEPDIAIVQGPLTRYVEHHPFPAEIALVVEVAETSLLRDRRKARMYARAGIAQYWIVNLRDGVVEVCSQPQPTLAEPAYGQTQSFAADGIVEFNLPGEAALQLAVREFLPS